MHSADAVLLDTHAWIWFRLGEAAAFRRASIEAIQAAADRSALRVSVISVWEVAMLAAKRRLRLEVPVAEWVRGALGAPGLLLAELTPEIAVESCGLPGEFHDDPADRMIVATARVMGATLYTKDRSILSYGRRGHVKVAAL
jgi:PIN domain nuclease of toxin-antitoxin system